MRLHNMREPRTAVGLTKNQALPYPTSATALICAHTGNPGGECEAYR